MPSSVASATTCTNSPRNMRLLSLERHPCRCCTDCHQPDLVCLKAPHNRNRVPSNSCCIESPGRIHRQRVHIGRRSAFSPCLHLRALYQCQYGMPSLTEAATQPNLSAPAGCTTTMKAPAIAETEQTSKSSQEDETCLHTRPLQHTRPNGKTLP